MNRTIPRDEAVAVAVALRAKLDNPNSGYDYGELLRDSYKLAAYTVQPLPEPPPPFPGVGVPLDDKGLKALGFVPATEAAEVYSAADADARELKYTLLGDDGKPTLTFLDDEDGAAFLPCPADQAGMRLVLAALRFQPV